MRRSIRCFWFGLAGVVPFVGASLAWQALQLFKTVEPRHDAGASFRIALWITLLIATPFIFLSANWPPVVVAAILTIAIDAIVDFFRQTQSRWNPAARMAWAGATLARAGLGFSAVCLTVAISRLVDSLIFGLR